ncbi:cytochrome P450, partial [Coniella lustricola]
IVLINSLADKQAPLKKLLTSCASRAPSLAAGKYLSGGKRIVLQPYGADWLRHRRAFSMLLTKDKVKTQWAKALRFEALTMVERIVAASSCSSSPSPSTKTGQERPCIVDEVSRFTASSVLQIAYGLRATTPTDPVLQELETVSRNIGSAFTPGKYWADNFPLLDLIPAFCAPWKKRLTAHHEIESSLFSRLLQSVEQRLSLADASDPSAGQDGKFKLQNSPRDDRAAREEVAYLAAGLFEAGTETTAMTINTFLLAAACYPEMTRKAQDEIDQVVLNKKQSIENHWQSWGSDDSHTVPTFEDLEQMPYLAAIVRETLRLTPTGSSGVGHTPTTGRPLSCDLVAEREKRRETQRLTVAPGVTVLANIYGLHHDQEAFPDPWRFYPGRWLHRGRSHGHEPAHTSLDHTYANLSFGFGKRICPGGTLASYSLSMALCLLLWCFDF